MSLIKLNLPPDEIKRGRFDPEGSYLCRAIGNPEKGIPFTRVVVFKDGNRCETNTIIEFVSIRYGKKPNDPCNIQIIAPKGVIPSKSELGDDGIVCIMQENTPRCEECGLNLVKRFDVKKQEFYMVCPANRWGLNFCKNVDRHDMNCRRESEEERKRRLKDQSENPYGTVNWGEKYGLDFRSYEDYLKSDLWKQKRKCALFVLGNRCQICRCQKGIVVHHVSYERIGKELIEDLSVLCKMCHKIVHALVAEDPKEYTIQNCPQKILSMTTKEFFALKEKIEDMPEYGLGYVNLDDTDRETAAIVTSSWSKFPATQPQNNMLRKLGYKGSPLNKQEAFFKIRELNGEDFKEKKKPLPANKCSVEFEDPCFLEDQARI